MKSGHDHYIAVLCLLIFIASAVLGASEKVMIGWGILTIIFQQFAIITTLQNQIIVLLRK